MKNIFSFILIWFLFFSASAQFSNTVILKLDSCKGKDATIADCAPCGYPNSNYGDHEDFIASSWTNSGSQSNTRALIDFDLSRIPAGAVITNAKIFLYHNPSSSSGNNGHAQNGGSNAAWLRRITDAWDEYTVTWNNQPATTTQNQVTLPASSSNNQDYLNVDVTALVQDMVANPQQSFGFLFQLQTETPLRSMLFASSDYPNAALHPKLEVSYTDTSSATCISLRPDNSTCNNGVDAVIGDCGPCGYPNSNYGNHEDFIASSWTNSGNLSNTRALINFDLSAVPANAIITSAGLSLYYNPASSSGNNGHSQNGGSNAAWLRRITAAWDEHTVTWNNQPATSTQNEVTLAASNSNNQDYMNIDVAALVQDMISNPQQSFGFMLQLKTESPLRSLLFASSDHPNSALHPKLDLCYTVATGIKNATPGTAISVYPNPSTGAFHVQLPDGIVNGTIKLLNPTGEKVYESALTGKLNTISVDLATGIYFVQVTANGYVYTTKFIKH